MEQKLLKIDMKKNLKKYGLHVNVELTNLRNVRLRFWVVCKLLKIASFVIPFKSIDIFDDITDENSIGKRVQV